MTRWVLLALAGLLVLAACNSTPDNAVTPAAPPIAQETAASSAPTTPLPAPAVASSDTPSPPVPTVAPPAAPDPTVTPPPTPTEAPPAPLEVFVNLEVVAQGLTAPVALADPDDGTGRLFVADQIGLIRAIAPGEGLPPAPLLDIRDRLVALEPGYDERGLLGMALHPAYRDPASPNYGEIFVYYSAPLAPESPPGFNHTGRLSAFRVDPADPTRVTGTERVILEVAQPQFNHNGGQVAFGPDGLLYLGLGDGGAQYDFGLGHGPAGNAQDPGSLLGTILRLDVSDPTVAYTIPTDNPAPNGTRPEVYARGFRNPYRFSFDSRDGTLLASDVGQDLYEEINIVTPGGNYGWRIREGASCFNLEDALQPLGTCATSATDGTPLSDPILAYDHTVGRSVIGGYVYRGEAVRSLRGRYVFGDWQYDANGLALFTAVPTETGWVRSELSVGAGTVGVSPLTYLFGFGVDAAGELYALTGEFLGPTGNTGKVLRLVPARR